MDFFVYVTHELTLSSLRKVLHKVLPTSALCLLLQYIFLPIIVIVGCIIIGAILKKLFPRLYGLVTGMR